MIWNILCNIVIPVVILSKFSGEDHLGPVWGLIIALMFPISYGSYDLIDKKKWNFVSILGLVSVLLTGGLALLKLDGIWFAVKEAAIPTIIGLGVVISLKTKYSFAKVILYNPKIFNVDKINQVLEEKNYQKRFEILLYRSTMLFVFSFVLSAILNFVLAVVILKSPSGTPEFNAELGKMTALSFPVIMVPCTVVLMLAIWYLIHGIKGITGLDLEGIINNFEDKK
ncbi:MAG: MFS transporter [Bacteriovoracaceae bacterium]|nr:MFS transporter [Bacteriovoracaceae bacterium]